MKIKLRISIFGMLMLLILIFGDNSIYSAIALSAAAVHEIGHIIAAKILGVKFKTLSLNLLGARLGLDTPLYSYKKEFLLCAAGPAINIITGIIALYLYHLRIHDEHILFFAIASFFLALLNLLPIKSFDGGRILYSFISRYFTPRTALNITRFLSFINFNLILETKLAVQDSLCDSRSTGKVKKSNCTTGKGNVDFNNGDETKYNSEILTKVLRN